MNVVLAVEAFKMASAFEHLCDVAGDVLAIIERSGEASERDAVYVIGRGDAAQHLHLRCRTQQRAEAEAGESVGFGKGAADEEIVDRPS